MVRISYNLNYTEVEGIEDKTQSFPGLERTPSDGSRQGMISEPWREEKSACDASHDPRCLVMICFFF